MKALSIAAALLALGGCSTYDRYAGATEAEYTLPDGRRMYWRSNKMQQGFKAFVQPNGTIHIEVNESGSQESVLNALARSNERAFGVMEQFMQQIKPLLDKAATAAATVP